ncbi:hypothetical protein EON79_11600 [bacterium]|nr:MAG: hypothetical protein EON79_11600 [bacterium]
MTVTGKPIQLLGYPEDGAETAEWIFLVFSYLSIDAEGDSIYVSGDAFTEGAVDGHLDCPLGLLKSLMDGLENREALNRRWINWEQIFGSLPPRKRNDLPSEAWKGPGDFDGMRLVWTRQTGSLPFFEGAYNGHTPTWMSCLVAPESESATLELLKEFSYETLAENRPLALPDSEAVLFSAGDEDMEYLGIVCRRDLVESISEFYRKRAPKILEATMDYAEFVELSRGRIPISLNRLETLER